MISKPVPAHSFYHTCRYICQKTGAEVLIAEGVRGHDYKLMAEDFLNQQQMRPTKEKACFHSILSFYPGEKPSDETMKEIARKYLEKLGIVNTQVAVSKHTDKAHLHLHIVANMVDNEGKAISDSWIGLRGKKIAQQLTQEYKLIPALKKDLKLTNLEALSQAEANKYKIFQAIAESLPQCRTLEDLEKRLLKLGIETQYKYKGQTQEKQGISFRMGNVSFKGSQVDRQYSLGGLQKALDLQQKQQQQERPRPVQRQQPEQATRPAQKPDPFPITSRQKKIVSQSTAPTSSDPASGPLPDIGKGMGNMIADLLKPIDDVGGGMPYELTEEAQRRKKRKRQRPH